MNNLAAFPPHATDAASRAKIVNLSVSEQIASLPAHSYEKLPILMSDRPARRELKELADSANAIAPVLTFGTISLAGASHVSMTYWRGHSFGAHRFDLSDFPPVLLAKSPAPVETPVSQLDHRAVEEMFRFAGVTRVVSMDLDEAPSKLWLGIARYEELTASQLTRLAALAPIASRVVLKSDSADDINRRHNGAAELIGELFNVLDVRTVFGRVSEIARKVLPHDVLGLGTFNDDLSEVTLYACTCEAPVDPPRVTKNRYPLATTLAWDYHVFDDLSADPFERDGDTARAGFRSALRVPIRFGDRLIGGLEFAAREPNKYTAADVKVGRRIAEYMALALSHHQMAEQSRRTAALRERAANLEMLGSLPQTLAGVLDVREVFDRVSDIAGKVLKHDALSIAELLEGDERVRLYASRGLGDLPQPFEMALPNRRLVTERWDFVLMDDIQQHPDYAEGPGSRAGMRSVLFVPIGLDGGLRASLNFYAREIGRFTRDDVLVAQRIADHVALAMSHQRLAEKVRLSEELRSRTTNLEMLDDLLATLTDEGDLPQVIERVSAIAQKVLPHDAMLVPIVMPNGTHVRMHAGMLPGGATYSETAEIPPHLRSSAWEYDIIDDAHADPIQRNLPSAKLGLRSSLRVPIKSEGKLVAGVVFLSKTPGYYKPSDVMFARRIADRLALGLARESGHQASKRADEADERALRLESRVKTLTEELDSRTGYRRVVGDSDAWRDVLTQATQVAPTDTTALLLGESGTGKEVAARFIHRASSRRNGPFVAINCAALPEQLLEAELFGYERGAFTGATQSKPGQLEQAAGGTLFLDEVAEMAPSSQAKFLRVLQEKEFQRLGGTRVLRTDARIIAATNRNLLKSIEQGLFREDLYYRLNVFAIHLPPLRERREDILALSDAFLTEISKGLGRPPAGISREARSRLLEYHWPGNVRELRNVLERAAILCDGGLVLAEHLALPGPASSMPSSRLQQPLVSADTLGGTPVRSANDLKSMERTMIEKALQDARFNKSKAAAILGLTRAQLYGRMRRYGLD